MPRELINATITHVSLVDKGANGKAFSIIKSDKKPTFEKRVNIVKSDDDQRLVTGVVYEPNVEDSHGDFMTAVEIEKTAHQFLQDYRQIDKQHNFESGYGEVVESYVAKSEHQLGGESITVGTWVMTVKVTDDESWQAIKKGEVTGFSMGGIAEAIEKQDQEPVVHQNDEVKGFFHAMKSFFLGDNISEKIAKGAVADKYERDRRRREFWAAQDALNSVIFNWDSWYSEDLESDPEKIREALQDFVTIAQDVLTVKDIAKELGQPPEQIAKAGKKISDGNMKHIDDAIAALTDLKNKTAPDGEPEEDEIVKKEDIAEIVKNALTPVTDRLDKLEKGEGDNPEGTTPEPEGGIADQLKDVLKQALAPIESRLATVEKARGISRQEEAGGQQGVTKSAGPSYMAHFNN